MSPIKRVRFRLLYQIHVPTTPPEAYVDTPHTSAKDKFIGDQQAARTRTPSKSNGLISTAYDMIRTLYDGSQEVYIRDMEHNRTYQGNPLSPKTRVASAALCPGKLEERSPPTLDFSASKLAPITNSQLMRRRAASRGKPSSG